MQSLRYAKIVATIGPASSDKDTIESLCKAGVDVFRLNFSHGSYKDHEKSVQNIRLAEEKLNRPIAIMLDLQGPKLRIGNFKDGIVKIKVGQKFQLDLNEELGNSERVYFGHKDIFASLNVGANILIDDGKVLLKVEQKHEDKIVCTVLNGTEISNRKGVNLPNILLPISSVTKKDEEDLEFGLTLGIDWVAVSFVQSVYDVEGIRKKVPDWMKIIAKIEKPLAIENLEKIIDSSDGIMVARGDLGVEVPLEQVPGIQKRILNECHAKGKPVIVATQMLDSMIISPTPTRAEVSDVANAISDGADAVMLSAETASGKNPILVVEVMDKIIKQVEKDILYLDNIRPDLSFNKNICSSITFAIPKIVENSNIKAIATISTSGATALMISRDRPKANIITISPNQHTARYLCLIWGVIPLYSDIKDFCNFEDMIDIIRSNLLSSRLVFEGDEILIATGYPYKFGSEINMANILTL